VTTLLLHPIGLDRSTWDGVPIEDALAIDLPGHGDGGPLGRISTLDDVADAVLDSLPELQPFDVVGVSLGGMTALHLALRHPDWVRSLVVACAPAATPTEALLGRAADTERAGMAGTIEVTIERWFSPAAIAADTGIVRTTRERLLADDPATVARYWRILAEHDVRGRLRELTMPVTVIAGAGDLSVPPAVARELADGVPGAHYVELDGPHMLHLEAPEAFATVVHEHVARRDD